MDWSAVSSAVAVLAAGIAFWSMRVSRQALKVSLRAEQRVQAPLELYLTEAYIRRIRGEHRRIYVFRLVVTNRADLPNSLRMMDLGIRYVRNGMAGPPMAIPHDAKVAGSITEHAQVLEVPSSIAARGVVAGAAIFEVRDEVLAGADVESYRLSVLDALGRMTELESIILQEHDDGEEVAPGSDQASEQG